MSPRRGSAAAAELWPPRPRAEGVPHPLLFKIGALTGVMRLSLQYIPRVTLCATRGFCIRGTQG